MSITTSKYRIGMSTNPANNFDIEPDGAGSLLIKRVSTGATVLKIDASGALVDPRALINVTTSRVNNQEYNNDTGMPIELYVAGTTTSANGAMWFYLDGAVAATTCFPVVGAQVGLSVTVPTGLTYRINLNGTLTQWREYRRAA